MTEEAFYTPKELAKLLKVSEPAIYLWMTQGKIAYLPMGRSKRIPGAKVQRILREGVKEGQPGTSGNQTPALATA